MNGKTLSLCSLLIILGFSLLILREALSPCPLPTGNTVNKITHTANIGHPLPICYQGH